MMCPVCGDPDAGAQCARCGTDLRALAGEGGAAHLEVVVLEGPSAGRDARKTTG